MLTRTRDFSDLNVGNHYRARYGGSSRPYSHYDFAYRFGYQLAAEPQYQVDDWLVVEMRARRSWKEQHPDKEWSEFKDAVRFAWRAALC